MSHAPAPTRPIPSTPAHDGGAAPDPSNKLLPASSDRSWDDAPLRVKVTLLLLLASIGGAMVGMLERAMSHRIWPLVIGLGLLCAALLWFAYRWVCQPVQALLDQVDRLSRRDRPTVLKSLPTGRQDEVGQLARALHQFSAGAVRDYVEARQLRRTLDHRVETATKQATRQLEELAMRDALTDLGNRRFLEEQLPPLFESCRNSGTDMICVSIDMDNFKQVNDTLGHAAGDELLRFVGKLIRGVTRHEDYAVRAGGDEFIVLMPGCPIERASQFAEQLTALFRQHVKVAVRLDPKPDLSVGIASMLRDRCNSSQALIDHADRHLYEAKRGGKGQVRGG